MPLPASGPLSFSAVNVELNRAATATISLGETAVRNLAGVASGAVGVNNLQGKSSVFARTITTNQTDLNLRNWLVAQGWDQITAAQVTINSGVWISGSVAGNSTAALTISGSFPNGVTLVNNGTIAGRGGTGGTGQADDGSPAATAGQAGGRALLVSTAVTIDNNGTIAGGGGGGGGSGRYNVLNNVYWRGAGGGGGRSNVSYNGTAGSFGAGGSVDNSIAATAGTSSAAGIGGRTGNVESTRGGDGGGWGASGVSKAAAGGAAGQAVNGNSFITWQSTGTRLGPIV